MVSTFRRAPLAEISGSLGDLGTLLPLMIALAVQGSVHLGSTLVFSGAFNIITGVAYGIPLPVQPMKAIASAAISSGEDAPMEAVVAAGQWVGAAVLVMSVTGLLRWAVSVVPIPRCQRHPTRSRLVSHHRCRYLASPTTTLDISCSGQ
ncbi:hypothetical protein J3458_002631 [Metarhizium acridum]|uniref:uncharacterized protein n=1 Tax=Metarhizium acridum TaxID=92637 RepID=UPI001C6C7673|nr:hypothetical protein J3458_002631 [Metarhizium acridum]